MAAKFNYEKALIADTVEQFKEKPKIAALLEVFAKQLQDIEAFFEQLNNEREISVAVGKQLDGIGDILCLNRIEAGLLSENTNETYVIDDELYRRYLYYKLLKNNTDCTYKDIIKGLGFFWDKPLYYRETSFLEADRYHIDEYIEYFRAQKGRDPADDREAIDFWYSKHSGYMFDADCVIKENGYQPATMIFDTGDELSYQPSKKVSRGEDPGQVTDITGLMSIPLIRAAGVTLRIYAKTTNVIESGPLNIQSGLGMAITETRLPDLG